MSGPKTTNPAILKELLDRIEEIVLVLDSRRRIVQANGAAAEALGYAIGDLPKKGLSLLLAPAERERMAGFLNEAKDRREGETIFLSSCGREVPARFSLSPLADPAEEAPWLLLVGHRIEGRAPFSEAEASRDVSARLLKGFADPLFIVDGRSRLVRECNDLATETLGYPRGELVGKRLLDHGTNAADKRRNKAVEARATKTYAIAGIFQERILFPRKDGSPLTCDLVGIPFFDAEGRLDTVIAMIFDRSIEEESEAELAELIEQIGCVSAKLRAAVSRFSTRRKRNRLSDLGFTSRQIEIARQCATGAPSKEIGFRLGIAESTVKNHLAVMYRKLGVNSKIGFLRLLDSKRILIE
jgi:PAS domain S-box-containing protein